MDDGRRKRRKVCFRGELEIRLAREKATGGQDKKEKELAESQSINKATQK